MKVKQIKGNRKAWTDEENMKVLALYFSFLDYQRNGEKYQKAAPVRAMAESLERSKGSIECKLMNISAIRAEHNGEIVKGYKPLSNYNIDLKATYKAIGGDNV